MALTLRLEIVTPQGLAYGEDVERVVLPGIAGELGIYPQHVALMMELKPGELRILKGGQESAFAVGEGFVEITATHVNILTDMAVAESAIDEGSVEKAIERAQAALKNAQRLDQAEVAALEGSLQKSLVQQRLKRKQR